MASIWDSGWAVGIVAMIFKVWGSMTVTALSISVVTYSKPFLGPTTAQWGRTPLPKSTVPTTSCFARSTTRIRLPSVPGLPTPEFPYIGTNARWPSGDAATSWPVMPSSGTAAIWRQADGSMMPSVRSPLLQTSSRPRLPASAACDLEAKEGAARASTRLPRRENLRERAGCAFWGKIIGRFMGAPFTGTGAKSNEARSQPTETKYHGIRRAAKPQPKGLNELNWLIGLIE